MWIGPMFAKGDPRKSRTPVCTQPRMQHSCMVWFVGIGRNLPNRVRPIPPNAVPTSIHPRRQPAVTPNLVRNPRDDLYIPGEEDDDDEGDSGGRGPGSGG